MRGNEWLDATEPIVTSASPRPDVTRRIVATDLLAVTLAAVLGMRLDVGAGIDPVLTAIASVSAWMTALAVSGSRSRHLLGSGAREFLRVLVAGIASLGLAVVTLTVLHVPVPSQAAAQTAAAAAFVVAGRLAWRIWLVRRRDRGDHSSRVLVAGTGGASVARRIAAAPAGGLYVADVREGALTPDEIVRYALAARAEGVVLTSLAVATPEELHDLRWRLEGHGIAVIVDTALTGIDPRRLAVWNFDGAPLVRVQPRGGRLVSRAVKSVLDRVCALLGLLVLAPFLLVVAALIRAEDRGPVFFRQTRVGKNGSEFEIVKFRTMRTDAEQLVAELQAANEADGPLFKMREDPRVTRIGRVLRKYSIDELPQLWNVLAGEMSLVGPRPALPREVAEYGDRSRRRLLARPGITGLWQVSGRSDLSWEHGVGLDIAYIDNWSLLHDGIILGRTVGAVIRPRGAY